MQFKVCKCVRGREDDSFVFSTKEAALNHAMLDIMQELGNGDGENGDMGSLWKCAGVIHESLDKGYSYSYADCKWRVIPVMDDRKYRVMCSIRVSKPIEIVESEDKDERIVTLNALNRFETELRSLVGGHDFELNCREAFVINEQATETKKQPTLLEVAKLFINTVEMPSDEQESKHWDELVAAVKREEEMRRNP